MANFDVATAVTRRDDGSYEASVDPGWTVGGIPNGGYLLSIMSRAAVDASGQPDPIAISGHFLRPPEPGTATIEVNVLKVGRRTSTVSTTLWQHDKPRLAALVTTGALPGGEDVELSEIRPPAMPPVEDCVRMRSSRAFPVLLQEQLENQVDPATMFIPKPTGHPSLRAWFRLADGTDPSPLAMPLAVDGLPPTVFNLSKFGWAPTVELTLLIRCKPAPGWLLCNQVTMLIAGGWFDEEVNVFDSTGTLVAQGRQLALVGSDPQQLTRPDAS